MKRFIVAITVMIIMANSVCMADDAGKWMLTVNVNPVTSDYLWHGNVGDAPLILTGIVINLDPVNALSFDGITLKTDDAFPLDPILWESLWTTDPSVEMPGSYIVAGNSQQIITLGSFNMASAFDGVFRFKLLASASYDYPVAANPPEIITPYMTIDVVPEPASIALFASILAAFAGVVRKR